MRWSVLLLLFLGCPPAPSPTVGTKCSAENIGRCDAEAARLLQCTNGTFRIYADCHGPKGCSVTSDTADCDTSGNSVGDRCAPTSEGKVRCDPDGGVNILRCNDGGLEVIFECPAPQSCGLDDGGALTCL
jgi:hypothetical protein